MVETNSNNVNNNINISNIDQNYINDHFKNNLNNVIIQNVDNNHDNKERNNFQDNVINQSNNDVSSKTEDNNKNEISDKMFLYYSELEKLFNGINNLKLKIKNYIEDENKFEEYLLLSRKFYNGMTKIFESENKYQNENIIFDNISDIIDIKSLDSNILISMYNLFQSRIEKLKDEILFKLDYENIEIDKEQIKYPKDFLIVEGKNLEEFLLKYGVNKELIKNQTYQMILGERCIFIKDNSNKKNIFVCKEFDNNVANIEVVIQYKEEEEFSKEIKKYIKQKSFEYYLMERSVDLNKKIQNLLNKEKEDIGKFIIVTKSNPYIKGLFFALLSIQKLNYYFQNNLKNENNFSFLLSSYSNIQNKNLIVINRIVNQAEKNWLNYQNRIKKI